MHLASNSYFELEGEKFLSHEEELVFEKIPSVESILSQFFIYFQFSFVILADQIFMSFMFHTTSRDIKHDSVRNPRIASPRQENQLSVTNLRKHISVIRQLEVV